MLSKVSKYKKGVCCVPFKLLSLVLNPDSFKSSPSSMYKKINLNLYSDHPFLFSWAGLSQWRGHGYQAGQRVCFPGCCHLPSLRFPPGESHRQWKGSAGGLCQNEPSFSGVPRPGGQGKPFLDNSACINDQGQHECDQWRPVEIASVAPLKV